ncbi:hypothetical protein J3459_016670 [Metarhizium acridum]|nr:hypothetical protein J3459_016670 [Metarhizium acridum]
MQQFQIVSNRIVDRLIEWNNLASRTVNKVQHMNYLILSAYRHQQSMIAWAVIPAPAVGDAGVVSTLQHFGHVLSTAIVGDREKKATKLLQLFAEQASKAAMQLNTLLVDGKQLESDFSMLICHLLNIKDLTELEKSQLGEDEEALLSILWALIKVYKREVGRLKSQEDLLKAMIGTAKEAGGYLYNVPVKIPRLNKDSAKLYQELAESKKVGLRLII